MKDFTIEQAEQTDVHAIGQLFDLYRIFYHKQSDVPGAVQFLNERMTQKDSVIYIAKSVNGEILGFTQLYPLFSSTRMKRLWLLNDLFVSETHRGQGISKALIQRAKDLAKETKACGLMLETQKTNKIGNQLYPAMGFELENESNFYFWTMD